MQFFTQRFDVTICHDFVSRQGPRPLFRIEKQEDFTGWEILMGKYLLIISQRALKGIKNEDS